MKGRRRGGKLKKTEIRVGGLYEREIEWEKLRFRVNKNHLFSA
jgi:hypothetical protein